MDNNPLTYILTSAKLDVTGQRWVASLANYDFRIFYQSGKTNVEADALSQIPRHTQMMDIPTVKAIIKAIPYTNWSEYNMNPTDIVCESTKIIVHKKSRDDWKIEQEQDLIIGPVITIMQAKNATSDNIGEDSQTLLCGRSRLLFRSGLLYRNMYDSQLQESKFQFVLPKTYWKQALEACHDNMGHFGIERTTSLLRDRFYWPSMTEDIEHHVKTCP